MLCTEAPGSSKLEADLTAQSRAPVCVHFNILMSTLLDSIPGVGISEVMLSMMGFESKETLLEKRWEGTYS